MYKLLIFTVVGLCTLLVAKCDEEEFKKEFKVFIESGCTTDDEEIKEKVIKCIELFPENMKEFAMKVTETDDMRGVMKKICDDEKTAEKLCDAMKEKKEEMKMDEDTKEEVKKCMEQ